MKKILIAVFCFLSLFSKGQVYQSMPQYGYAAHRMSFDSTLQIPTFCGVPTLKSNVLKFGAIAFDSCNNRFYFYNPKTAVWDTIKGGSGGGGSTDTTSLSNRINLKLNISDTSAMLSKYLRKTDTTNKFVNNITRTLGKDSIIYFIGSTRYAIKDSVGTNPAPVGYYGAFQDNTTQTATTINTPYAMKFGITDLSNGITIVSDGSNLTRITIANTGIYNIQFSAQFDRTNSGTDAVDIWLRKNGTDVAGSGGKIILTGGSAASAIIASWNYVLDIVAGDYYQLMWSTPDTHVRLLYEAAQTTPFVHPIIPSTILTVTQQSGIMAGTGMTALNGLTGAVQTFALDSTNTTFKITSSGTAHTFNIPNASASGVTRGLISNTQYTTFNGKIGSGDTASMLTNYAKTSAVNLKVNISDTASMLTNYAKNSAVNLKVNISDTATMLTPYSRKFAAAYTMNANNTNAAASEATQTFRDSAQKAYTGTIVWTGTTAPSGATNHSYRWFQVGKLVTLRLTLIYATAGVALTSVLCALPSDCPTPEIPTGSTANSSYLYIGSGSLATAITAAGMGTSIAGGMSELKINSGGTGYEINIYRAAASGYITARATIQYFAQ